MTFLNAKHRMGLDATENSKREFLDQLKPILTSEPSQCVFYRGGSGPFRRGYIKYADEDVIIFQSYQSLEELLYLLSEVTIVVR